MIYKFTIEGRLPNYNDYTKAERISYITKTGKLMTNGSKMKKEKQKYVCAFIRRDLKNLKLDKPVKMHYHYFEPNKRRDPGNFHAFCQKVTEDALQECGVLPNDNWEWIKAFTVDWELDKKNPRIEVEIEEIDDGR